MDWVIDASLALAWGLPDERSPQADGFLSGISKIDSLWVPSLWWFEVANALTMARRRHRVSEAHAARLIQLYGSLPIQTDTAIGPQVVRRLQAAAQEHSLSAYDAAYLDLAIRRSIAVATLDERLRQAAERAGLQVFPS